MLFAVLVRSYSPYIRRMARDAGIPAADLDDVSQEVLCALQKAVGRGLNVAHPLNEWLQTTTYRIARARLRLARHARELVTEEGEIDPTDEGPNSEVCVETIEVRRMVLELLDELPHDQRLVITMSDIDEMPMRVIADVLEIPEGTGYSRLRAARRAFESAWARRREQEARHTVALGIAPFLLFDARALLKAARSIPDALHDLDEQLWGRLVEALGSGLTWGDGPPSAWASAKPGAAITSTRVQGGAGAVTGGHVAGVLLTARQIVLGVVLSIGVGAGIHGLLRPAKPDTGLVRIAPEETRAATDLPQSSAERRALIASATATATASPEADAGAPIDATKSEMNVLARARAALSRAARAQDARDGAREIASALAALEEHERRFKRPSFGEQRDALRHQVLAYQNAHPIPDGGKP
ncbi:MAG: RNA polymerase sigma factor [Byssovorax sp.]